MRLTDYLELLRRRRALVALIVLGTTIGALALAYYQPPLYKATARMRVRPVAPASDLGQFLQERLRFQTSVQTEAELVKSAPVAEGVLRAVPGAGKEPADLLRDLEVVPLPNTDVLLVSVTSFQPSLARDLANAFVDSYIDIRRQQAAQEAEAALGFVSEQVKATQQQLNDLDAQLDRLEDAGGTDNPRYGAVKTERDNVLAQLALQRAQQQALLERGALSLGVADVIERASRPEEAGPDLPRNAVLGFLIGIPLAIGAVLLLDSGDTTLKTRSEAEAHTEAGVLGVVPRDRGWRDPRKARLVTAADPLSPAAESYRMVAVNVAPQLNGLHRVLVTSPGEGEGKSATAANLAVSFMEAGYRVALVSMDFRRPRLHDFFGARPGPGLSDVLTGRVPLEESVVRPSKQLAILPSGAIPEHPHRLVLDAVMDGLMSKLLGKGDNGGRGNGSGPGKRSKLKGSADKQPGLVIIDAPATLEGAEVSSVAGLVDGVVLVLRANQTTRSAAGEAAEQIRRSGGTLLGVVLVHAPKPGRAAGNGSER